MRFNLPLILMISVIGLLRPSTINAQIIPHSISEIDSLLRTDSRKMVIFIHTDLCKYCQAMKQSTLKNKNIQTLLNEKFWYSEINAECNQDIIFNNQRFKYKPSGANIGIHELAEQLATINGAISYPTLCILNSNYEIIFQFNQFLNAEELKLILEKVL